MNEGLIDGEEISKVGGVIRVGIGGNDRVVRKIVREERMGVLKKMKGGRAADMDGIVVKMLKNGGIRINDWLMWVFNKCMESGVVPEDWKAACIVQIYKGTLEIIEEY